MPAGALGNATSAVARVSALTGKVVQSLLIVLTLALSKARLTIEQRCLAVLGAVGRLGSRALRQRARSWRTPGLGRVGCLGVDGVSGA